MSFLIVSVFNQCLHMQEAYQLRPSFDYVDISDCISLGVAVVGLIIALFAYGIGNSEHRDHLHDKAVNEFRSTWNTLSKGRFTYSTRMKIAYDEVIFDEKSDYLKELKCLNHHGNYISKESWISDSLVGMEHLKLKLILDDGEGGIDLSAYYDANEKELDASAICYREDGLLKGRYGSIEGLPDMEYGYAYNVMQYLGKGMYNSTVFCASDIIENDDLTLSVKVSDYISFYDTCEVQTYLAVRSINPLLSGKSEMTKAELIKKNCINLLDFDARYVAVAMDAVTVFKNVRCSDGIKRSFFLIHERSSNVNEAMGTISGIPAGSFMPVYSGSRLGHLCDLEDGIVREFEEEVLNHIDAEFPARYVRSDFSREYLKIYYLGMGFDPLSTKFGIMTLIVVDADDDKVWNNLVEDLIQNGNWDKGWFDDHGLTYDNLRTMVSNVHNQEGSIRLVEFNRESLSRFENNRVAMPVFREMMGLLQRDEIYNDLLSHRF